MDNKMIKKYKLLKRKYYSVQLDYSRVKSHVEWPTFLILIVKLSDENKKLEISECVIDFIPVVKNTGFVLAEDTALNFSRWFQRLLRVSLW